MLNAIFCAAAVAVSAPAAAANLQAPRPVVTRPESSPVDPDALAEARALLRDLDFETQLERTASETVSSTFDTMMRELRPRLGEEPPPELVGRVRAILMEHTSRVIAELRPTAFDAAARIYARHFTVAELIEIRRIQTNPVMVKLQRLMPQILPELMQIGVAASARHQPELNAQLRQVIERWESEHANHRPPVS